MEENGVECRSSLSSGHSPSLHKGPEAQLAFHSFGQGRYYTSHLMHASVHRSSSGLLEGYKNNRVDAPNSRRWCMAGTLSQQQPVW